MLSCRKSLIMLLLSWPKRKSERSSSNIVEIGRSVPWARSSTGFAQRPDCQLTLAINWRVTMDTERDRLFTVEDVASLTGVSPSTIRNYTRNGAVSPRRGWNSEAGRSPTLNRRCWLYTKREIDEIVKVRIERRSAMSRGLDRYWARVRNESN